MSVSVSIKDRPERNGIYLRSLFDNQYQQWNRIFAFLSSYPTRLCLPPTYVVEYWALRSVFAVWRGLLWMNHSCVSSWLWREASGSPWITGQVGFEVKIFGTSTHDEIANWLEHWIWYNNGLTEASEGKRGGWDTDWRSGLGSILRDGGIRRLRLSSFRKMTKYQADEPVYTGWWYPEIPWRRGPKWYWTSTSVSFFALLPSSYIWVLP